MIKKKIVFVTGTRADFGKIEPLAKTAKKEANQINFFVTGMHMLSMYGLTKIEVHKKFKKNITEFKNQKIGDPLQDILTKTIIAFDKYLDKEKPDLVIVHGDRVETLACSIACSLKYVRCAHIEGGELSGTIDEVFRHAVTKFSYSHFVSNEIAVQRLIRLGEDPKRIYKIGSPELDSHASISSLPLSRVKERYEIPFKNYGICMFHPVTSEIDTIYKQANSLFTTLEKTEKNFVIILPNNDPGTEKIVEIISNLNKTTFRIIPSMQFEYFSVLLKNSSCFIGNSSACVREAPFLGIPSLNIGSRQVNRAFSKSIKNCSAYDKNKIKNFIRTEWNKKYKKSNEFGIGKSADVFSKILKKKSFWNHDLQKIFWE